MKLGEFFTLTGAKDCPTQSRVDELMRVMQNESNCLGKDYVMTTVQWISVGRALAATDKDSLHHFIQLNGLQFLNSWLQEAQKFCDEDLDFVVEGSIIKLLEALEMLPLDQECLKSSGIAVTVKNLFDHKSLLVQNKANDLYESWKKITDLSNSNVEKGGMSCNEGVLASETVAVYGSPEQPALKISSLSKGGGLVDHLVKPTEGDILLPGSLNGSGLVGCNNEKILKANNHDTSLKPLIGTEKDYGFQDAQASSQLNSGDEKLSTEKQSCTPPAVGTDSAGALSSPFPVMARIEDESSDVPKPTDFANRMRRTNSLSGCSQKLDLVVASSSLVALGSDCSSAPSSPPKEPSVPSDVGFKEGRSCLNLSLDSNMSRLDSSESMTTHEATSIGGECCSNVLKNLSSDGVISSKPENPESSICRMEVFCSAKNDSELIVEVGRGGDFVASDDVSKPKMDTKDSDKIKSRLHRDELEQEVGDYREALCNFSEDNETKENVSGRASQNREEPLVISCDCKQETSMMTKNAQELASNSGKGILAFDLNEETHPEEMDCQNTPISTPITGPIASKQVAIPALAMVPLQIEGTLGSNDSSVTSTLDYSQSLDGYKTVSIEASCYSSKQRQDLLEFDLNVAEGGIDGAADTILTDQIPVSSGILSGESSIEVSSERAERLKLDLNCLADNDDVPPLHTMEGESFNHCLNGLHNPSLAASSSSRQSSKLMFDLNKNISFVNDSNHQHIDHGQPPHQGVSTLGGFKQNDSVIFIMGSRVEVNTKEIAPSCSNLNLQSSSMVTEPQGFVDLQHASSFRPPPFGYSSSTLGSSMSQSAMYGPGSLPYMIDSRGAPLVMQITGSGMVIPSSYSSQPFLVGMNSMPLDMNGAPSQAGFDLNSSLMMVGSRTREFESLRPGTSQLKEEHMWSTSQCPSSGMGLKRMEPDSGWELCPVGYKQQHI